MTHKLLSLLHNKILIVSILILIQLLIFFGIVFRLSEYFVAIYFVLIALSFYMSVYIINKSDNPAYKLTWVLLIMTIPVFGDLIYLLFGGQKVPKELRKRDGETLESYQEISWQNIEIIEVLGAEDPLAHKQADYLWKNAIFPIYNRTETTYSPAGEEEFKAIVEELRKAENFIFMEYFVITSSMVWDTILDILTDKVKQDIEVRVMYDDAGYITTLPQNCYLTLRRLNIQAKVFNPIRPRLTMQMNNRDHRKIFIIDGRMGVTEGINLADERINQKEHFSRRRDCSVMIREEAIWNLTPMFLRSWDYSEKERDDIFSYKPDFKMFKNTHNNGYVQPYSDSPTDGENVEEYTRINMINSASRYAYATTPYLTVDNEMKTTLLLAARSGIDVRVLMPHVPDEWYVFTVTRSNYEDLIEGGVKIYEYIPGFVHGRNFVIDDKMAIIGTINMDYRSHYLYYECGVWSYHSKVVTDVRRDYPETLSKSHQVTLKECQQVRLSIRIMRAILNLFSPMI